MLFFDKFEEYPFQKRSYEKAGIKTAQAKEEADSLKIRGIGFIMASIISYVFYMDTGRVEIMLTYGTQISIDCTAVENEVADNMYQRSELDFLIYNDPMGYTELILNGEPEKYLKVVTVYCRLKTEHKMTKRWGYAVLTYPHLYYYQAISSALDDLVPKEHLVCKLEAAIDWRSGVACIGIF